MLSIRFKPVGKKKQISFRVVVVERRSKLQGRFIEDLGWCNTHTDTHSVKEERIKYWLGVGAQPTDSVHNMLVRASVVDGPKRAVHAKKKVSKDEEKQGEEVKKEVQASTESQNESVKEDIKPQSVEKAEEAKSSALADDHPTHLSQNSNEFREKEEVKEEPQPQKSVEEEEKAVENKEKGEEKEKKEEEKKEEEKPPRDKKVEKKEE